MYFQKVAELEHLTKAAEALHIAQPALSRTIRSMEEELDVSLFTHQGRNIHLTRDGHILLKYTNKILGSLDDLRQELQDSRDLQQLTVKLAIMSSSRLIPAFLMKFNAQIHNVALPVGDQECHRDLNISWKTDSKLSLSAVLLREYIVDHFWEFVRDNANKTFPMQ